MTKKLIQSLTAASVFAAFAGAQEEREHEVVIERPVIQDPVKVDGARARAERGARLHEKMMSLIDKLSRDDLSSQQRKKVTAALMEIAEEMKTRASTATRREGFRVPHIRATPDSIVETGEESEDVIVEAEPEEEHGGIAVIRGNGDLRIKAPQGRKKSGRVVVGGVAEAPRGDADERVIYFVEKDGKSGRVTQRRLGEKSTLRIVTSKSPEGMIVRTRKADAPKSEAKAGSSGGASAKGRRWQVEVHEDEDVEVHEHGKRRGNAFFGRVAERDDDAGQEDLLELIEEMRREVAELRAMMREIREHTRANRAGAQRARARLREAPAVPPTRARRLRWVREGDEENQTR